MAEEIVKIAKERKNKDRPFIIGLEGKLGSGKTALTKLLAEKLGIEESVNSPTFIFRKDYETKDGQFRKLVHIDAYRFENPKEISTIGWDDILSNKDTIVVIEWVEKTNVNYDLLVKAQVQKDIYSFQIGL